MIILIRIIWKKRIQRQESRARPPQKILPQPRPPQKILPQPRPPQKRDSFQRRQQKLKLLKAVRLHHPHHPHPHRRLPLCPRLRLCQQQ